MTRDHIPAAPDQGNTTAAEPPHAQVAVASQAGSDLRAARTRLGCSLSEAAVALHIRPCHLEALEAGRVSDLPGNAYAVAYVRSYAARLASIRISGPPLQGGSRGRGTPNKLTFPVPMPDRGVPAAPPVARLRPVGSGGLCRLVAGCPPTATFQPKR